MDKEQAIEIIETHSENILSGSLVGRALSMAIDALKAQLSSNGTTSDLISRTETAEHLRRVLDATVPVSDYDEGYVDGVEFGISTVSTMPTVQPVATDTNVGNTISRQQAIDAAKDWYEGLICGSVNGLIKRLNALPTVQPEPQEGHWIDKGWNGDWAWQIDGRGNCWRVIECSECGKRVLVESNYCPNCGAKMTISTK